MSNASTHDVKTCSRCGGPVFYSPDAIVPGDPTAPHGSHRSIAHHQPAWVCVSCGHVEPEERRAARIAERQAT
jgi:ribosomal protein S27AE